MEKDGIKTATVFNFKNGRTWTDKQGTEHDEVHFDLKTSQTQDAKTKKTSFDFIDSWNGAKNKRSVWEQQNTDKTDEEPEFGWSVKTGAISEDDISKYYLYTYTD
ncbi:MAG: hypothetical protein MJB14_07730 [Spirochaetes bacterium]|nr:hypothetical protein [Spirochaetota bacterium]